MVRDDAEVIPELLFQLQALGFKRFPKQTIGGALLLSGALRTADGPISCILGIDREFRTPPRILLTDLPKKLRPVAPHIGASGELCYAAKGTYVFDIHDPVRQNLALIKRAEQVLDAILQNKMQDDLAEEFFAYWGEWFCFIDVESAETGVLQVYTHKYREGAYNDYFLTDNLARTSKKLSVLGGEFYEVNACVVLISTCAKPRPSQESWPPKNLGELIYWQRSLDKNIPRKILSQVQSGYRSAYLGCLIVIASPVYKYGFMVELPPIEMRKSLKRHSASYEHLYPLKLIQVSIERVDDKYLTERNMPGVRNLTGMKIAMVGCGTIGGYLSELLVKAGAGVSGGKLTIIDPDTLGANNLGRHRLGFGQLNQFKAYALESELKRVMPSAEIEGIARDVRDVSLPELDLLIDATGDESLGYWIAEKYHKKLPILSVWIEGRGVAIRSLLKRPGQGGCFRCLCDYGKDGQFCSVEENLGEVFAGHGCEGLYVPFPATVSVQAACLAVEAALDLVGSNSLPSLRTRVIAPGFSPASDDCSPITKENCPACCS
nr:ThiF family adenylyltransferase [Pseudomonas sp. KB-10]